jgi:hypothetical protein
MTFDDEPYWPTKKNAAQAKQEAVVKRSIPDSTQILDQIEKRPRAKNVSPLLEEWLKENNPEILKSIK